MSLQITEMKHFVFDEVADEALAYDELKEDFVFGRIAPEDRQYYVSEGIRLGRECAAKYEGASLADILADDNVEICRIDKPYKDLLHSQITYDGKLRRIDIFSETCSVMEKALANTSMAMRAEEISQLFLAHEFYHWTEYASGILSGSVCRRVKYKVFGLFNRESTVTRISEIAAFTFAKEFCKAGVHPKAMDYVLLCYSREDSHEKAQELLRKIQAEYKLECVQKGALI